MRTALQLKAKAHVDLNVSGAENEVQLRKRNHICNNPMEFLKMRVRKQNLS